MESHESIRQPFLEYLDILLRTGTAATERESVSPLPLPERYGYGSSFPALNSAWARYYPAIDVLVARTDPWLLRASSPDAGRDGAKLLEELCAQGWEVDDVREVTLVRAPPDPAAHDACAHELAHVDFHKLSWWSTKLMWTNCHANMLFYNVLHTFKCRQADLVNEVTDLLAFEWNSERLQYAVRPLQEAVATIVGVIHAKEETVTNIEQAIKNRQLKLKGLTMEKQDLRDRIARLDDEKQKARIRNALHEAVEAEEPLDRCPLSLRNEFPTLSISAIKENKRHWRICQEYYELQVLNSAKKLLKTFDDDSLVKLFLSHLAIVASDCLSSTATAAVPASIISPSNRFLEALDVAAAHPNYYKRTLHLEDPSNEQEARKQRAEQSYEAAHRLLRWLGLTPAGVPFITGPLKDWDAVQGMKSHTADNKFLKAVQHQLDVTQDWPHPLFLVLVADGTPNVCLWLPDGWTLQDLNLDYFKLNFWMTALRWLFIDSLVGRENMMESPVLNDLRPAGATDCIEQAVGTFTELDQNDQLDRVIQQGLDKLHHLDPPAYADPLVP